MWRVLPTPCRLPNDRAAALSHKTRQQNSKLWAQVHNAALQEDGSRSSCNQGAILRFARRQADDFLSVAARVQQLLIPQDAASRY